MDIKTGLCECMKGILKGPCKHKSIVAKTYKMKNGIERDSDWFRPLLEEQSVPLVDWNVSINEEEDEDMSIKNDSFEEQANMSIRKSLQSESDEEEDTSSTELLAQLKKSVFCFLFKVQNRFGHDSEQYKKAINAFIKQCDKLSDGNDKRNLLPKTLTV